MLGGIIHTPGWVGAVEMGPGAPSGRRRCHPLTGTSEWPSVSWRDSALNKSRERCVCLRLGLGLDGRFMALGLD